MAIDKNCGCQETTTTYNHCNKCEPQTPCDCPVIDLSTDCILFKNDDIFCDGTPVVIKNINLTKNLQNIINYICQRFTDSQDYFKIINTGTGSKIYSGDSLLGEKKLRTIVKEGNLILITENTDEISLTIDEDALTEFIENLLPVITEQGLQDVLEVNPIAILGVEADGTNEYRMTQDGLESFFTRLVSPGVFRFSSLRIQDRVAMLDSGETNGNRGRFWVDAGIPKIFYRTTNTAITNIEFLTPTIDSTLKYPAKTSPGEYIIATLDDIPVIDGSETKVTAGTNISVSGIGTTLSPYIITNTFSVDGSETKINSGTSTTVTGTGTTGSPYVIETKTIQKVLTYPADFTGTNYTLTNSDAENLIFIVNGSTAVTITVPTGLPTNFFAAFIQEGTADVSFTTSGTTINSGSGLKIKGQFNQVALDKKGATTSFYLTGNTKV